MQNIPGAGNPLFHNGKKLRNWWQFIGDFDAAMGQERSFVYSEPVNTVKVSMIGSMSNKISTNKGALNWSGSSATGYYEKGTNLTLTAEPVAGTVFAGWGGDCSGTALSCTLIVDVDKSISASFSPE